MLIITDGKCGYVYIILFIFDDISLPSEAHIPAATALQTLYHRNTYIV